MEVSDRCAIKATPDGKPDFSALLSYGNEAVMLEKLITETEKEMQAVRDAAKEKDLQKLDSLIHHLAQFVGGAPCRPTAECTLRIASWRCSPGW